MPLSVARLRWLSFPLLIVALSSFGSAAPTSPSNPSPGISPVADHYGPEVRLRKIHLVRPDLISYPLCYEIYC
jgi:hypothetical protein